MPTPTISACACAIKFSVPLNASPFAKKSSMNKTLSPFFKYSFSIQIGYVLFFVKEKTSAKAGSIIVLGCVFLMKINGTFKRMAVA